MFKKNILHKIMDAHFEEIERKQQEQERQLNDYENNLMIYHCLRDWGCSSEEITRLCKPENKAECDKILRFGV